MKLSIPHCLIFHNWTKYQEIHMSALLIVEEKKCIDCGKTKRRTEFS